MPSARQSRCCVPTVTRVSAIAEARGHGQRVQTAWEGSVLILYLPYGTSRYAVQSNSQESQKTDLAASSQEGFSTTSSSIARVYDPEDKHDTLYKTASLISQAPSSPCCAKPKCRTKKGKNDPRYAFPPGVFASFAVTYMRAPTLGPLLCSITEPLWQQALRPPALRASRSSCSIPPSHPAGQGPRRLRGLCFQPRQV